MGNRLILATVLWAWSAVACAQVGPVQYGALPNCQDSGGNHLNYSSGTFTCGTTGSGATVTINTYTSHQTTNWTRPSSNVAWVIVYGAGGGGSSGPSGANSSAGAVAAAAVRALTTSRSHPI